MEDSRREAVQRMEVLCDAIVLKLEACVERFDDKVYEAAVTKLKFLGQKYIGLRQTHDWTNNTDLDELDRKVKDASRLVKEIRKKWGASSGDSPHVSRKNRDDSPATSGFAAISEPKPLIESPKVVADSVDESNNSGEADSAPVAKFDALVQKEHEGSDSPTRNPWKDVSLFGVARFDYVGDASRKLLSFKRGDCLLINGEAREWYRGRLMGASASVNGLVPMTYVEAMTPEDLLHKYRDLSDKLIAIREEKDHYQRTQMRIRDKVKGMADVMRRTEAERDRLTIEKAHMEKALMDAQEELEALKNASVAEGGSSVETPVSQQQSSATSLHDSEESAKRIAHLELRLEESLDRISELELEVSILGTPIEAPVSEQQPSSEDSAEVEKLRKRIAVLEKRLATAATKSRARSGSTLRAGAVSVPTGAKEDEGSGSPEIDGAAFSNLLSSLDEGLADNSLGSRKTVPLFGSPLAAICEADNSLVPIFVERLCEQLLKNDAAGLRTPGIFRLSAQKNHLDKAKEEASVGLWNIDLDELDFIVVADLLKTFLRELGEPLLTNELFPRWILATKIKSQAVQIPYIRALLASLPPENVALIEFLCNFIVIAVGYQEESKLTLSNAALLFAPMFLEYDPSMKMPDAGLGSSASSTALSSSIPKRSGFTPLFSRRKPLQVSASSLNNDAMDIKALMTSGVAVLEMLLVNFQAVWSRFHQTAKPFTLYKAIKDSGPVGDDELEFKKGTTIGFFHKVDNVYGLGELNGAVGRFQLEQTKVVKIGDIE